ncbi:hypothetical protein TNCV_2797761 [Trichonephila clavipes]|nr:hypothetical protein TNCV_2797761 [Trichonephila clavipes]
MVIVMNSGAEFHGLSHIHTKTRPGATGDQCAEGADAERLSIQCEVQWLSGSVSRFHAAGLGFKSRAGQGRISFSSLQWIDKEYQACLGTEHWGFHAKLTT